MKVRVPASAAAAEAAVWDRDHPVTGTASPKQLLLHIITTSHFINEDTQEKVEYGDASVGKDKSMTQAFSQYLYMYSLVQTS